MSKPYFADRVTSEKAARALWTLRQLAELAPITLSVAGVATHPQDDLILAAAASVRADYLVTGDRMLQQLGGFRGTFIIAPSDFLRVLQSAYVPPEDE